MRFLKLFIFSFILYTSMLIIVGGIIIFIGFSMGNYNIPNFLLVIMKIVLYPVAIINSIIPNLFSKSINDVLVISVADLTVSFFLAITIAGIQKTIKRF